MSSRWIPSSVLDDTLAVQFVEFDGLGDEPFQFVPLNLFPSPPSVNTWVILCSPKGDCAWWALATSLTEEAAYVLVDLTAAAMDLTEDARLPFDDYQNRPERTEKLSWDDTEKVDARIRRGPRWQDRRTRYKGPGLGTL